MSYLVLQQVCKHFQQTIAVQDLWLEIEKGEILSLLGPSGCGKSTTLQLIAGILPPDRGFIALDGRSLHRVPPEQRDIALVLQRGLLFPHLSVGENVAFGLKMRGVNRTDREQQAIAMLRQVQLHGFADRKPAELSGGQAQRVALARSLVIHPKLLLLDEPLSALDANLREEMQDLILHLHGQTGVTMMLVTHDQTEAVVMSHRIALMIEGRLRQVDPPERIYHCPCDETVARFMGGVNFFPAIAAGHRWTLPGGMILSSTQSYHGPLQVTIRPEQIQVNPQPRSGDNRLPATVVAHRFAGTQRRLTLQISPTLTLYAAVAPTQEFQTGQSVWAYLPPDALWYFPGAIAPAYPVQVPG